MQGAAADSELFRRGGDIAARARERLQDQLALGFVEIERAPLRPPRAGGEASGQGAAAWRTFIGNSRSVIFGPFAMTTPCSIAVRNSRTFPGQS